MENLVCRHNKYGHCRYKDVCRNLHVNEMCQDVNCETVKCKKRHPRKCKFFQEYKRCKFGEFCSFDHTLANLNDYTIEELKKELENVKIKVDALEKQIEHKNFELTEAFKKISETQNESLITIRTQIIKTSMEAFEEAVAAALAPLSLRQDELEHRNDARLDSLLTMVSTFAGAASKKPIDTSTVQPKPGNNSAKAYSNHPKTFPCNICGQFFDLERSLRNHIRSQHNLPDAT